MTFYSPFLTLFQNYSSKFKLDPPPSNKIETFGIFKILFLRPQEAANNSKFFWTTRYIYNNLWISLGYNIPCVLQYSTAASLEENFNCVFESGSALE